MRAHEPPLVVRPLAGQDGRAGIRPSRACAQRRAPTRGRASRTRSPGWKPRARRRPRSPVSVATDETPSAIDTGLRTPIASGPIRSRTRPPAGRWPWLARTHRSSPARRSRVHQGPLAGPRERCRSPRRRAGRASREALLRRAGSRGGRRYRIYLGIMQRLSDRRLLVVGARTRATDDPDSPDRQRSRDFDRRRSRGRRGRVRRRRSRCG